MRTNERGLSTGALVGIIIGIVVAVVVPVTIVAVLLMGGGGGGGALATVPVYPGAVENTGINVAQAMAQSGYTMPAGWAGKAYNITESPATVITWYRTQMTGWTNTADNAIEYLGITVYVLAYEKGNDAAVIEALSSPGEGDFLFILAGPKQTSGPGENTGGGTGSSIIGTWEGTHLGSTETFTFKNDGTYDWSSDGGQQSGTWSMSENILRLDSNPPDFKVVFAPNSMKWYEQDPDTGNWDVLGKSFTKVA